MAKERIEIPPDVADGALFSSDRTCCVCREKNQPVQLHHIDDDPSNSVADNLAVLCFHCHDKTQLRGGFGRKLNAAQVRMYKAEWITIVQSTRKGAQSTPVSSPTNGSLSIRYMQLRESSEEQQYDFGAEYALLGSIDQTVESEVNGIITANVTGILQRFRFDAARSLPDKVRMKNGGRASYTDSLWMTHEVSLFSSTALSLVFNVSSYSAGAAHPNHRTDTLNFILRPAMQLHLFDVIDKWNNGLERLSQLCVTELHKQKAVRWSSWDKSYDTETAERFRNNADDSILRGAAPTQENYRAVSFTKTGITVHFDPYQVSSYAEGKYDVLIPAYQLQGCLDEAVAAELGWFV